MKKHIITLTVHLLLIWPLKSYSQAPAIPLNMMTNTFIGPHGSTHSSGNVGIGLENPQFSLDIYEPHFSPTNFRGFRLFDDNTINHQGHIILSRNNNAPGLNSDWGLNLNGGINYAQFRLFDNGLNIATSSILPLNGLNEEGLTITPTNRFGFGTKTPSTKFHIVDLDSRLVSSLISTNAQIGHFVRKTSSGFASQGNLLPFFGNVEFLSINDYAIVGENYVDVNHNTGGGAFIGTNLGATSIVTYPSNSPIDNGIGHLVWMQGRNPIVDKMNTATGYKGFVSNSENSLGGDWIIYGDLTSIGHRIYSTAPSVSYGLNITAEISTPMGDPISSSSTWGARIKAFGGVQRNIGIETLANGSEMLNIGLLSRSGITGSFSMPIFIPNNFNTYNWGTYSIGGPNGTQHYWESGGVYAEALSNTINSFGIYAKAPTNGYAGYFNGSVLTTASQYYLSDENLKENIHNLKDALNIISKLIPKEYNFKKNIIENGVNLDKGKSYGLIAQDLEKELPELVKSASIQGVYDTVQKKLNYYEEIKAINYVGLIPILIKAIQEQQEIIEELKIDILKRDLNNTENQKNPEKIKNNSKILANFFENRPNPFRDKTTIYYEINDKYQSGEIFIMDLNGKKLKSASITGNLGEQEFICDELPDGLYLYSLIINGNEIATKKMVISRK